MSRVGILTFSDGRDFVHQGIAEFAVDVEGRIAAACEAFGAEVVRGTGPITSSTMAVREARRLAAQRPDLTIFNYPVWAFPHFSVHAAHATVGPLLLFSNIDPTYPGMVGMLAAGGSLDQLGRSHERLWGDVEEEAVATKLKQLVAAAYAAR
jgi:L-fucose isomerase